MNNEQKVRLQFIKDILLHIIEISEIGRDLIFKWGTSLMLFHKLDRFSEDLDFNYFNSDTIIKIDNILKELWYKYILKKTQFLSKFIIEYIEWNNKHHCIIDLVKYDYQVKTKYDLKIFWWKPIKILTMEQNFAHKLCAFYERKKWRDVVDINFYISKWIFPDEDILKERHWRSFEEFLHIFIKELQTPYLNIRLTKALDQLHYDIFTLFEYKKEIIQNISNQYTNNKFNIFLDYKEKLDLWDKIIPINNEYILFVDGFYVNPKINWKYSIINKKDGAIIYECNNKEKIYIYINKILIKETLKIKRKIKLIK